MKPCAPWSAATCRRLFRLTDLSVRPRRVQRRNDTPTAQASQVHRSGCFPGHQIVDGDKSPADSGDKSPHSKAAFSLIELVVILCVVGLLLFVLAPRMIQAKQRAKRISCVSRMKQTGLSFRLWANDNVGQNPFLRSVTNGGTLEVSNLVWRSFQVMSNELGTPFILACPADTRTPAVSFERLQNTNISYFIGIEADETNPQMLLSGDHHLGNGRSTTNKVLTLHTNDTVRWTGLNHQGAGNIALADGSVQQLSSARL